jgi:hypothetical protein
VLSTVALASGAFLLLVVFFSPSWVVFRAWRRAPETFGPAVEVRRGVTVLAQAADPGAEIRDPVHRIVRWRLLVPAVAHVLRLPPAATLGLSYVGCVVALAALIALGRRGTFAPAAGSERQALSASEAFGLAVVCGSAGWFFASTGWLGYYDSLLLLGLLVVAWSPHPAVVVAACVLTPWVDERFVLGFPLALAVRWLVGRTSRERSRRDVLREAIVPALAVIAFVALRLTLAGAGGSPEVGTYASWIAFDRLTPSRLALGAWQGLRVGWSVLLAGVAAAWSRGKRRSAFALALLTATGAGIGLFTSNDPARSMVLLVPLVPLGWGFARGVRWWSRLHAPLFLAAAALLLPAQHVVSDFTRPIWGLWREMRQLREPPPPLAAATYGAGAESAMRQGDLAGAARLAWVAVRLDPESAAAHNLMGVVLARLGRQVEAERELGAAVALDPANNDYRANLRRLREHPAPR